VAFKFDASWVTYVVLALLTECGKHDARRLVVNDYNAHESFLRS
jgi:hypothetical protein